jgi:cytidylate kinase
MGAGKPFVMAIDGPAASGKSTLAIALARRFGLTLVDSGAMYRAVTLIALERDVVLHNEKALGTIAESVSADLRIDMPYDSPPRIMIGDRDVTQEIRSVEVGDAVSEVSRLGAVRNELVRLQRSMVTDGRARHWNHRVSRCSSEGLLAGFAQGAGPQAP